MEPTFFQDDERTISEDREVDSGEVDYTGGYDLEEFKSWFKTDSAHSHDWRIESKEAYDYVAGTQWSQEDAAYLKLSLRPIVTFNRIAPVVDSVTGLEVNNRQQVCYFPRHLGDAGMDELLTGAAKWCRDECQAEDEESDAFSDLVICGMGWTETKVTYDDDLDGKLIIDRQDPLLHYWDAGSTKKNLSDARRVWYIKDVPLMQAEEMFPDVNAEDLHAAWAAGNGEDANSPHNAQEAPFYRNDQSGSIDKSKNRVRIAELQWWEHVTIYRLVDPLSGKEIKLSPEEYETLLKRLRVMGIKTPQAVKQRTKQYWKAFIGGRVLQITKGPEDGGFTRKCMTGKRDRNKGSWYGLVRAMIDPQKWANKWLSQTMHILNTNAKGGLLAEKGAFENPQQAEDSWAQSDAITWLNLGGMAKIKEKPKGDLPPGMQNLMEFAIGSIRDVSGINLEMLGQADRNQPGILEHQRKQAAMTILAGLFDSLRRYRKEQGKLLLHYITTYLSDGRLIKIGGQDEAKYVPLIRNPDVATYDVIVDDMPNSVNVKEATWAALQPMMPLLEKAPPKVLMSTLKYSPLPTSLVGEITDAVLNAPPPAPDPKIQAAQQADQAKLQQINAQAQADTQQMLMDQQFKDKQAQRDAMLKDKEFSIKDKELDVQAAKVKLDAAKIHQDGVANRLEMKSKVSPEVAMTDPDLNGGKSPLVDILHQHGAMMAQMHEHQMAAHHMHQQNHVSTIKAITAPKKAIHDANGKLVGSVTVQ